MASIQLDGVRERFSGGRLSKAQYTAANQAMLIMNAKYVPMDTEHLRNQSKVTDSGRITWSTPYAKAQFYGVLNGHRVMNYTTAGTSRRWDLRMKANKQDMADVKRAAAREVLR